MKTIYIDLEEFKCHIENDGTMIEYETDYFDGKCNEFIEGYRVVPEGYFWTREDGKVFHGITTPWVSYNSLVKIQDEYMQSAIIELQNENNDMKSALNLLGVEL